MDNIHKSWKPLFEQYDINLDLIYSSKKVYPPQEQIFRIFEMDLNQIRVVLIGQDPYHSLNQANGLSFSVNDGIRIPPSLRNIYKELKLEFPTRNYIFNSGNIEKWFYREKIFLLNSSLSVEDGIPLSHINIWKEFTNDVINYISINNHKCVFLLLGTYAKTKNIFIHNKQRIISGPHPSPLAKGFIGSNVFLQVEELLNEIIDWSI
jgi:uracil-DNA glycosylase